MPVHYIILAGVAVVLGRRQKCPDHISVPTIPALARARAYLRQVSACQDESH